MALLTSRLGGKVFGWYSPLGWAGIALGIRVFWRYSPLGWGLGGQHFPLGLGGRYVGRRVCGY